VGQSKEFKFAEILVGKLLLETFSNEQSPYHSPGLEAEAGSLLEEHGKRLKYHIARSLSPRQKQVMKHYLQGLKEREIARRLGITQQVVNIYKHRAIKKLSQILTA